MKIKTNDQVKVLSGKDKGKTGKVLQVFKAEQKIVVEGLNKIKKHLKSKSKTEPGQVIELSSPFAVSKVMLICSKCGKTTRVGYKMDGDRKKRVCSACQQFID